MGALVIRMFVVIALLVASMMSPAIAHAGGQDVVYLSESAQVDLDFDHDGIRDGHQADRSSGGDSGNVLPHHHCTAGLALIVPEATLGVMPDRVSMFRPLLVAILASWQSAPPIPPPAA